MKTTTLWATIALISLVTIAIGQNAFAEDSTAADNASKEKKVDIPADRVAVMYFHRTQRCPTCKKIGSYVEEAVKKGFADQLKDKTVGLYFVDFQQEKNAKIAKAFKVTGPTLVLAKVVDNKTAVWQPMPKVWKLVGEKDEFFKYVQGGVKEYLKTPEEDKQEGN